MHSGNDIQLRNDEDSLDSGYEDSGNDEEVSNEFTIPEHYRPWYAKRYLNTKRNYIDPINVGGSNTQQCGCAASNCNTKSTTWGCGFCNVSMRSTCVHEGAEDFKGVCRNCFILYYAPKDEDHSDDTVTESRLTKIKLANC